MPEHDRADPSRTDADSTASVTYYPECPLADCDVSFLGATEDDVVQHIVTDHADRIHPHWSEGDVTTPAALHRLVQEASGPLRTERPATRLDRQITSFLDAYLVYVVLAGLALILGWPLVLYLLFP